MAWTKPRRILVNESEIAAKEAEGYRCTYAVRFARADGTITRQMHMVLR